jgi:hypothetical protein
VPAAGPTGPWTRRARAHRAARCRRGVAQVPRAPGPRPGRAGRAHDVACGRRVRPSAPRGSELPGQGDAATRPADHRRATARLGDDAPAANDPGRPRRRQRTYRAGPPQRPKRRRSADQRAPERIVDIRLPGVPKRDDAGNSTLGTSAGRTEYGHCCPYVYSRQTPAPRARPATRSVSASACARLCGRWTVPRARVGRGWGSRERGMCAGRLCAQAVYLRRELGVGSALNRPHSSATASRFRSGHSSRLAAADVRCSQSGENAATGAWQPRG